MTEQPNCTELKKKKKKKVGLKAERQLLSQPFPQLWAIF